MMLYKRHKNEYERIIMNDDWVEQKCCECQFYSDCDSIHVLAPSRFQLSDISKNKIYRLNKICGICKGIMKSPKILYYDPKTKKDS